MGKRTNFSKKRAAILDALRQTNCHPTADWVYGQVKPRYPDLSLGTVYRNLKMLCDTGAAVSLGVLGGKERFDGCIAPHSHFICEKCGLLIDVAESFFGPEELQSISSYLGCDVRAASVLFHGVCRSCKAAGAGKEPPEHFLCQSDHSL